MRRGQIDGADIELPGVSPIPASSPRRIGVSHGYLDSEPLLEDFDRVQTPQEGASISALVLTWLASRLPTPILHQLAAVMAPTSRTGRLLLKLQVSSEPGLTNAQLMLTNHDLKPVEPERRQWGAWNFVGFWIVSASWNPPPPRGV